jgi:hypothetical protein
MGIPIKCMRKRDRVLGAMGRLGYLDVWSSIAATPVRQRGEEDSDVVIRVPPSPPVRLGFLSSDKRKATMAGGSEI